MTRQYAAIKLLEHGPLTFRAFKQITGWGHHSAKNVLWHLMRDGIVMAKNIGNARHWALTGDLEALI